MFLRWFWFCVRNCGVGGVGEGNWGIVGLVEEFVLVVFVALIVRLEFLDDGSHFTGIGELVAGS